MIRKTHTLYLENSSAAEMKKLVPFVLNIAKIQAEEKEGKAAFDDYTTAYAEILSNTSQKMDSYAKIVKEDGKYYVIENGKKYSYSKYPWGAVTESKIFLYNDFQWIYKQKERKFVLFENKDNEVNITTKGVTGKLNEARKVLAGTLPLYSKIKKLKKDIHLEIGYDNAPKLPNKEATAKINKTEKEIKELLKLFRFNDQKEYSSAIKNFTKFFKKKAHAFVEDYNLKYGELLSKEEKKIEDESYVKDIYRKVKKSGANKKYKKADKARKYRSYYDIKERAAKDKYSEEIHDNRAAGKNAILALDIALVKMPGFEYEAFSEVQSVSEMKVFLKSEIKRQRDNIKTSKSYILKEDTVFHFKDIILKVLEQEGISEGSVLYTIIIDKIKDEIFDEMLHGVAIAIFVIGLALLTGGAGIVGMAATATVTTVGAYVTIKEIEGYLGKKAAFEIGLTDDDPNIVWVIISILGTAFDTAALAKLINSVRLAHQTKKLSVLVKEVNATTGVSKTKKEALLKDIYDKNKKFFDDVHPKVEDGIEGGKNFIKNKELVKNQKLIDSKTITQVEENLKKIFTTDKKDIAKVIKRLKVEKGGNRLAQRLANKDYVKKEGYKALISNLKLKGDHQVQKAIQAFDRADELIKKGYKDIFFERSTKEFGYDGDVGAIAIINSNKKSIFIQLKYVTSSKQISKRLADGFRELENVPKNSIKQIELKLKSVNYKEFSKTKESTFINRVNELNTKTEKTTVKVIFSDNVVKTY